jgi:hypothetical protein
MTTTTQPLPAGHLPDFFKCQFAGRVAGQCHNPNFQKEFCYYHRKVVDGLIVPEKITVTLSSLPSYSNLGDD